MHHKEIEINNCIKHNVFWTPNTVSPMQEDHTWISLAAFQRWLAAVNGLLNTKQENVAKLILPIFECFSLKGLSPTKGVYHLQEAYLLLSLSFFLLRQDDCGMHYLCCMPTCIQCHHQQFKHDLWDSTQLPCQFCFSMFHNACLLHSRNQDTLPLVGFANTNSRSPHFQGGLCFLPANKYIVAWQLVPPINKLLFPQHLKQTLAFPTQPFFMVETSSQLIPDFCWSK